MGKVALMGKPRPRAEDWQSGSDASGGSSSPINTAALLSTLREQGVKLWVEQDQIRCSAPVGALNPTLRATLASRKQDILALLRKSEGLTKRPPAIVPIKGSGSKPPIFAVSGHGGDVFYLLGLARHLDAEQPMFGIQPPGLDGSEPLRTVEALARYEIEQIRRHQPQGPYLIAGHCAGGVIAFEVAQQLTAAGQEVAFVALIGSAFPTMFRRRTLAWVSVRLRIRRYAKALTSISVFASKVRRRLARTGVLSDPDSAKLAARQRVESTTITAVRNYKPQRYAGQVDLFITSDKWHKSHLWRSLGCPVQEHVVGNFEIDDLLLGPDVGVLARSLQGAINSQQVRSHQVQRTG